MARRKKSRKPSVKRPRGTVIFMTPAEMDFMKALWVLGEATCGEVRDVVAGEDRAFSRYAEIQAGLRRMEDKGLVSVTRMRTPETRLGLRQTNIYRPVFGREELLRRQLEAVERWFVNQFEIGGGL